MNVDMSGKDNPFLKIPVDMPMSHRYKVYSESNKNLEWLIKEAEINYFKKEIVTSNILNNSVTLHEPTHTFNEYFNRDFFSKFEMIDFKESFDPAAEQIEGRMYPGYFIVVCKKK
jgi:hypothetical protein